MRFSPLFLLFLFILSAVAQNGKDLRLTDGTVLKNARIERVDGAMVIVLHEGGEARVPLRRFEPEMQRELLGVTIGSVMGVTTNASRAAAAKEAGDGVVVTASAIPLVEPFALTPEDARARRLFDDVAKKKAEKAAKDAKNAWTLPVWKYVPFRLVNIDAASAPAASTLKWNLQTTSVNTYGAPDPRTGK